MNAASGQAQRLCLPYNVFNALCGQLDAVSQLILQTQPSSWRPCHHWLMWTHTEAGQNAHVLKVRHAGPLTASPDRVCLTCAAPAWLALLGAQWQPQWLPLRRRRVQFSSSCSRGGRELFKRCCCFQRTALARFLFGRYLCMHAASSSAQSYSKHSVDRHDDAVILPDQVVWGSDMLQLPMWSQPFRIELD